MAVNQRIEKLREYMKERKLEAYIIPSSDPHQSEYLADHYKVRDFFTGFTGSAGTAVITQDQAGLWTDGRYFIQAEKELAGSEVELYRMGQDGVPTILEFLQAKTSDHGKVGLNGEVFAYNQYEDLLKNLGSRVILTDLDYESLIWEDRPSLPLSQAFVHGKAYAGLEAGEKIEILREKMQAQGVDYHFIGALEDICYLYNIRGRDVESTPVLISYALVGQDQAILYIDPRKIGKEVREYLEANGVTIRDYEEVFEDLAQIPGKKVLFLDPRRTNVKIADAIPTNVRLDKGRNMTEMMKAVKNPTEIAHQKNAYIKDGVALVKFFSWLETGVATRTITEHYAAEKLLEFRQEGEDFIEPSFGTISAYGENAALPHYSPDEFASKTLENKGLYLVDSGGQYLDGTTDITRTIKLGELTEDESYHYTLVLKAHISLARAKFLKGTKSSTLDLYARKPLWDHGLNFNHGTGHGVGYLLSVHEGPQSISMPQNTADMVPGMITSNEPGLYIEGSHGIRIENIVLCVEDQITEFGEFYSFETISYVPIDTRPLKLELLTEDEKTWLNDYNQAVYEALAPFLEEDALEYLEKQTLAI